jgi:hypothetical protein
MFVLKAFAFLGYKKCHITIYVSQHKHSTKQ